jgi:tetratricopeptide (TPR) repeat protein
MLVGEAGIGKSRLVREFQTRIAGEPHTWIEAATAPFYQNTPFYAVTDLLHQAFGWSADETAEQKIVQLAQALELAGLKSADAVPLVAPLLNLPVPPSYSAPLLSTEQQRKRMLATLATWVFGLARAQAMVIATEDLHWADPSSLELVQLLVEQAATVPLLLLYTARPEFIAPWPMRAHHAHISLGRLNRRQIREMIDQVADHAALPREVINVVVNRSAGVPLFVEELTHLVVEGDPNSVAHEIPATLHDSLMARLDRLGLAKEVAQVAVVIGQEFSYELLRAVSPAPEEELQSALQKLVDAELVYARGSPPEATYLFKHALIQDAAYQALLKSRRRELHRLVARAITDKFPAIAESKPEVLARHWTEAGELEPAMAAWRKAADSARERRAFMEAQEGYQQALAILNSRPESSERDALELGLQDALAETLRVTRGYSAHETVDATARTRALAEKKGKLAQLVVQEFLIWTVGFSSGDYPAATSLADRVLDLARNEGSPASLGFAHMAQVVTRSFRGDLAGSEDYFTRGAPFFTAQGFKQFPAAAANLFGVASHTAWIIGCSDIARERMREAIAVASENKNPFDLATAQLMVSVNQVLRREPKEVKGPAMQALTLSEEQGGFPFVADACRITLGWALANLGQANEGLALIDQGLSGLAKAKARVAITRYLMCLAEAQAVSGATGDALATIEAALQANPDELLDRPEALRIRGELRLRQGQVELAEQDFGEAIALAERMGAKLWKLRAAITLGRLLQSRGDLTAARDLLAPLYKLFTQGLDTRDLIEAKTLLDELTPH